ncbi:MAG: hypothetical protein ABW352_22105 [Polyangiales bacterium]
MALTHGLHFALFYTCMLALFGYLAFWFVPVALRIVFATIKTLVARKPRKRDDPLWFDGHHSQ